MGFARLYLTALTAMTLPICATSLPEPPRAKAIPKELTLHGDTRIDPYWWLREKDNPEVIAYLEAENQYTAAVMKPYQGLIDKLYQEIVGRIKETDLTPPARRGPYLYYSRTEKGKQYSIQCRRKAGSEDAPEEVILDLNQLAQGQAYFALGAMAPSPDHTLLAYTTDVKGDEEFTLYVKDLRTGELLRERVSRVADVEWANDNKTLFYTTIDDAKRTNRLWRHRLGTSGPDDLLLEEQDERFYLFLSKARSQRFLFAGSFSKRSAEWHFLDAGKPEGKFRLIAARQPEVRYAVEHHEDSFYITTNENAKNFRLMRAPVTAPEKKNWVEVLPHRPAVKIEDVDPFKDYLVIRERDNGLVRLRVRRAKDGDEHYVSFPEPAYSLALMQNYEYDTRLLRFRYSSLISPPAVYDYDMETRERRLLKEEEVLGGYDRTHYHTERIFAKAQDGAQIPIALVYRKGTPLDGSAPLLLEAYGSYGAALDPSFSSARLSLLDRGFIYARAAIRGGGELGEQWHEGGRMFTKKNTFTDFIAAAEHLIAKKYTSPSRLAIAGRSAGGLLIGAVVNMRPDLFHAAIAGVPFVDVVSTMLDPSLPGTVTEYEEWGNPNDPEQYAYIKSYSPYDNVRRQAYPHMLVTAGLNDPRVMYWEPAKWVAKLRAMKTDKNLLLLKTNMGAGHFGQSGRYERIREIAFEYAFLLITMGITE
jgi:oligopeptidase B